MKAGRQAVQTGSPYQMCQQLFSSYPCAVRVANRTGTIKSMVLMLQDGDDAGFFVLVHDCGKSKALYSLKRWRASSVGAVGADSDADVSGVFLDVVTNGVPIPRDGSLFGWSYGESVTALIPVYTQYMPAYPEPSWSVMPLADTPEDLWPPFTDEPDFGPWFWEHYGAGGLVWLSDLIKKTPDTVFWVDTEAILGSGCCVVGRDIRSLDGYTLRRGRYVYYLSLRAGRRVPSVRELLANATKIDMASRL